MLLELRLVPQNGSPPAAVADQPLTLVSITPLDVSAAERTRRFELQYRIIDLDPADGQDPSGLAAAQIDITTEVVGEPASSLTIAPAQLSRAEARWTSSLPPPMLDSSGLPLGSMAAAVGMHAPFRGGFAGAAPDNTSPSNGAISGLSILGITPLTLASVGQGDPTLDPSLRNAWYGLYSFQLTAGTDFGGYVTITASARADPQTGGRFGYFASALAVPFSSAHAINATATLVVINIPQPSSVILLGLGVPAALRRRRQISTAARPDRHPPTTGRSRPPSSEHS